MRQTFIQCAAATLLLGLGALPSQAQYLFKDAPDPAIGSNGLGAYAQNFDVLAGTKNVFSSNTTLTGVYAKFTLDGNVGEFESSYRFGGTPAKLGPDDGTEGPAASSVASDGTPHGAAWYHFGSAAGQPDAFDRALGGIASTTVQPGKGYLGIRLKNMSSKTIVNLEIQYAMEQWYNSSRSQAADVTVDYQKGTGTGAVTSLVSGTWTPIAELGVPAPSTSTAIAPRNGNAATNRRVKQTTLMGVNLAIGQEIMVRFGYVFNSGTNGNGLSIDDIVITPETTIYYSQSGSNKKLDNRNSWGTNPDGTGTSPANFTADNVTYYVQGTAALADRITAAWAVSGANSKIVVGTAASPAMLYVDANDDIQGMVDVSAGSTLQTNQLTNTLALGALHPTSTVEYINDVATMQSVAGASYGMLTLSGTGPKSLTGPVLLNSGLTFNTTGASVLQLNDYDVLLLKGTSLTGLDGANTLFVTNGKGALRRTVTNDNVAVVFPVGTSATSYTPATLSQSQAQSEDTYGVRVAADTYSDYSAAGAGTGTAIAFKNVKKTWFVDEEVPGNSNITLNLQWNTGDGTTNFENAAAHINHFANGAWDKYTGTTGASPGSTAGSFAVSRSGIASFSPFAVSSRADGALPVQLTTFAAQRSGATVACTWTTASEKNSRYFTVERSADGHEFEAIGKIEAAGSSSATRAYRFADNRPLPVLAYYRLRQTDSDGTEAFSQVAMVNADNASGQLVVVPNPGAGQFTLVAADRQLLQGTAIVRNLLGTEVLRLPLAGSSRANAGTFDLSAQPAGIYLVQIETSAGVQGLRVVKQ